MRPSSHPPALHREAVRHAADECGQMWGRPCDRYCVWSIGGGALSAGALSCVLKPWLRLNLQISVVGVDGHNEVVQEAF
jgi:hypothetical protein